MIEALTSCASIGPSQRIQIALQCQTLCRSSRLADVASPLAHGLDPNLVSPVLL